LAAVLRSNGRLAYRYSATQKAGVISEYLDTLQAALRFDSSLARRVRKEFEDHLREAVAADPGEDRRQAEQRAIANCGDPRAIGTELAIISLARRTRRLAVIIVLMLAGVLLLMRGLIAWYAAIQWTINDDMKPLAATIGIAVASGANLAARAADIPQELFGPATLLVVQLEVPPAETAAAIGRARAAGGRVLLNLAPAMPLDPALVPQIDLVVAKRGEAAALGAEPAAAARRLRQGLVVTGGAEGAAAWLADGGRLTVPALPIEPVDTTGAGDTFVGVLAAALDEGRPLAAGLRRAAAAAGLSCLGRGAQAAMPDQSAIERALLRLPQETHSTGDARRLRDW
jgi:hypothetical protein